MINLKHFKKETDEILKFNKKSFPLREGIEESFIFRYEKNPYANGFEQCAFLEDSESKEILGQFLVLKNQLHYQHKTYDGVWGFDFIVDERLRGQKKGKILAQEIIKIPNYGAFGLSDASEALHLKFGNKKLAAAQRYIRLLGLPSLWYFLFHNQNFDRKEVHYPEMLEIRGRQINRVLDTSKLPDTPYWNENIVEWDRSKKFLEWRFFSYPNKYAFYLAKDENFYFVVRKIRWRNLNCLLLVDYRYKKQEDYPLIYKMLKKIAGKTKSLALISVSARTEEQKILKKNWNFPFSEPISVVSTCTALAFAENIAITPADSDFDTFYGDNKW